MAKGKGQVTTTEGAIDIMEDENKALGGSEISEAIGASDDIVEVNPTLEPLVVEEKEKMVVVKSKIVGDRFIAGRWYHFEKEKELKVTEHVKNLLKEVNAIYF